MPRPGTGQYPQRQPRITVPSWFTFSSKVMPGQSQIVLKERGGSESDDSWLKARGLPSSPLSLRSSRSAIIGCSNFIIMPTRGSDNFMTGGVGGGGGGGGSPPLSWDKKGREQFSAEKNRNIYGGNRFRNIKKMAGTHFLIGIGNQNGKIGSKKGPEFGIPAELPEFRSDFPTKAWNIAKDALRVAKLEPAADVLFSWLITSVSPFFSYDSLHYS